MPLRSDESRTVNVIWVVRTTFRPRSRDSKTTYKIKSLTQCGRLGHCLLQHNCNFSRSSRGPKVRFDCIISEKFLGDLFQPHSRFYKVPYSWRIKHLFKTQLVDIILFSDSNLWGSFESHRRYRGKTPWKTGTDIKRKIVTRPSVRLKRPWKVCQPRGQTVRRLTKVKWGRY